MTFSHGPVRFAAALLYAAAAASLEAQSVPGIANSDTAAVFAPGALVIDNIYRGTFTPDARELYLFSKTATDPRREDYRILVTRWNGQAWSTPDTVMLGGASRTQNVVMVAISSGMATRPSGMSARICAPPRPVR